LDFGPTGAAEGKNHNRFQEIFHIEVSYFVAAKCYALDNPMASPPIVFGVGDAYHGSWLPSAPIGTRIWDGALNAVFRPDFVFPFIIAQGRLVTYTWTEAISASTAGRGRRHEMAVADAAPMQIIRWAFYAKHSHARTPPLATMTWWRWRHCRAAV